MLKKICLILSLVSLITTLLIKPSNATSCPDTNTPPNKGDCRR